MSPSSTMNGRMANVFTGLSVGFVGIIVMLSWWQLAVAGELRQRDENNQTAYYEQRVQRGSIDTADGVRLAGSVRQRGSNGDDIWARRYPRGSLAAHVLGYDTLGNSRAGVERALNDSLTGSTRDLGAVVGLLDGDDEVVGDDVRLTIDSRVQAAAEEGLAETGAPGGAAVAIDPRSGEVLAMASWPTFAPSDAVSDFDSLARREGALFNRATQGAYPPGSTFKVVTTAAALERGDSPDRTFPGGSEFRTPGGPIRNFGGASYGSHDFTTALTKSINTTFAELGAELGDNALREQMRRFGFFAKPPLRGVPRDEVRASGLTAPDGTALPDDAPIDEARTAIGQDKLTVSPLQMALVTAGIANGGSVPEPTLLQRITRPGGGIVEQVRPSTWRRAMEPSTARAIGSMMENVVTEGSGTSARIDGVRVAGKTGTADAPGGNITWFVAYAPADAPTVAVAVAVEGQPEGQTGGAVAAPIARRMIEAALARGAGGAA